AATSGNFRELFDEDGAHVTELIDNVFVVNYFLANVDRRSVQFEGNLHHVNGADDAGAKPARLEQVDLLLAGVLGAIGFSDGITTAGSHFPNAKRGGGVI